MHILSVDELIWQLQTISDRDQPVGFRDDRGIWYGVTAVSEAIDEITGSDRVVIEGGD